MQAQTTLARGAAPLRRRPTATDIKLRKHRVLKDAGAMFAISSFTRQRALAMSTESPHRDELLEYADRLERLGHGYKMIELVDVPGGVR